MTQQLQNFSHQVFVYDSSVHEYIYIGFYGGSADGNCGASDFCSSPLTAPVSRINLLFKNFL